MSFPRRVQAVNHRVVVSLALCAMFVAPVVPAIAHPAPRVGIMYEGWHAPAVMGLKDPMSALTVERVIRSNGTLTMDDMAEGINLDVAMGFFHQKEPLEGFYCIYRKRANESKGIVPDCLNISSTLSRHANMFNQNNISFVVADSTNIVDMGAVADVLQLRPFEVLAEEWLALRTQAIPTPQISVWQQLAPGSNLWRAYVEEGGVYSNPAYDALIFKDAATGKKVFFTTPNPDPAIVATLKAPPYNLAVVNLWALRSNFDEGEWSFFSPCTDPSGEFTTSVYSNSSIPCNQKVTTNSPIGYRGTSLTVGPSYQLSYSSLPFMAAGKLGGLTLKKQFERAFELHSLGALDYLFVGTFNEHIAQPQPNPYNPPNNDAVSFGLENDSFNVNLWVDMFGDSISRDLEPTREDGGKLWALFQSCLQQLRSDQVFWSGASSCNNPNELCCQNDPAASWSSIWSLELPLRDTILTAQITERNSLVSKGWLELCTPFGGASAFCKGHPSHDNKTYSQGPFLLYASSAHGNNAVYRCLAAQDSFHFISSDAGCHGLGTVETILGFASQNRTSDTPRSLRICRCSMYFYHSLDKKCRGADMQLEFIGFVH